MARYYDFKCEYCGKINVSYYKDRMFCNKKCTDKGYKRKQNKLKGHKIKPKKEIKQLREILKIIGEM